MSEPHHAAPGARARALSLDDLENLLCAWGRAYGERRPSEWQEDSSPVACPLSRAMEFAPGARGARKLMHHERGGIGRRRQMAVAAGVAGLRIVSGDMVDPVRCAETRNFRGVPRDWPVAPLVERVERLALQLYGIDQVRGVCLRLQYCTRGTQADKAADAARRLERPLQLRAYREYLQLARGWVFGAMVGGG